jgi:hypothetical protein
VATNIGGVLHTGTWVGGREGGGHSMASAWRPSARY